MTRSRRTPRAGKVRRPVVALHESESSARTAPPDAVPSPPESTSHGSRVRSWLVPGLLALHLLLAWSAAWTKAPTTDEIAHIPAGFTYWRFRDYRLNPEHPSLPKLWAAIPTVFMNLAWREDDPAWRLAGEWIERTRDLSAIRPLQTDIQRSIEGEWAAGGSFLYRWNRTKLDEIVGWSRFMMALISVAGAYLTWRWAERSRGPRAGISALVLYAFCPSLLAHAPVVHTDVPAAVSNLACLAAFFRFLSSERPLASRRTWTDIGLMSVCLGVSLLCKHSQLAIPGFAGLATIAFSFVRPSGNRLAWFARKAAGGLLAACGAALILEIHHRVFFGCSFVHPWIGGFRIVRARLAYVYDAKFYLMGRTAPRFPEYFLVAIALKTTLGSLIAMIGGFAAGCFRRGGAGKGAGGARHDGTEALSLESYLALYVAFFFVFLSAVFPNMGVRHALPLFPPLFLLAGCAIASLAAGSFSLRAAHVLLAIHVGSALLAWPNYISYMNALSLPHGKFHYLGDSNLDWGQDLPALGRRLREIGATHVRSQILSMADLSYYGVDATPVRVIDDILDAPPGTVLVQSAFHLLGNEPMLEHLRTEWRSLGSVNDTLMIHVRR